MTGYLKIFAYLSAGEIIVRVAGIPLPGPIVGLALMLLDFFVNRQADPEVAQVFDGVAKHLAVLFVPAGAGVVAHSVTLSAGLPALLSAIFLGTIATLLATAVAFSFLKRDPEFGSTEHSDAVRDRDAALD